MEEGGDDADEAGVEFYEGFYEGGVGECWWGLGWGLGHVGCAAVVEVVAWGEHSPSPLANLSPLSP